MKVKNILIIMVLGVVSLFSACGGDSSQEGESNRSGETPESSYEKGSAEYIVDSFLLEFKANNIGAMRDYMVDGIFSLDENSSSQNEVVKYTWDTITENFEYEIVSCEIKDDEARVMVKMRNILISYIMMDTYEEFNTKEISRKSDATEEEIAAEFYPVLQKYTDNYKNQEKTEKEVPVDLIKTGDKWEIVNDVAVFDAMTGDYISFIMKGIESYVIS